MFLETPRLILRKFREKDFADYCAFSLGDPERDRMMGRSPLNTVGDVRLNFNWLKDKEERGYALVLKETNKVIGNLTVYNRGFSPEEHPELSGKKGFSFSFGIANEYKRQGLIFEAAQAVINHLFLKEDADYVGAGHFSYNIPSRELQKKLDFSYLFSETIDLFGETVTELNNILWKKDWKIK